eukprot:1929111-Amphidinium_carterae.5
MSVVHCCQFVGGSYTLLKVSVNMSGLLGDVLARLAPPVSSGSWSGSRCRNCTVGCAEGCIGVVQKLREALCSSSAACSRCCGGVVVVDVHVSKGSMLGRSSSGTARPLHRNVVIEDYTCP